LTAAGHVGFPAALSTNDINPGGTRAHLRGLGGSSSLPDRFSESADKRRAAAALARRFLRSTELDLRTHWIE
jgi:hypothetical protein